MWEIIEENKKPSFGQRLGKAVGVGLEEGNRLYSENERNSQLNKTKSELSRLTGMDWSGASPEEVSEGLKIVTGNTLKQNLQQQKQSYLDQIFGGKKFNQESLQETPEESMNKPQQNGFNPLEISDEDIVRASSIDPVIGKELRNAKDTALKEKRHQKEQEIKNFESERTFHTSYSKKAVEQAESLRESIPKLEFSLDMARNAVESGEVGAFTLANLGERLGMHELQTAKGAQLVTAAKENLLGNMSRVSSRAQNKWFEQRLNSMMAKVGQSQEANLSAQEMLEAEIALNISYLNEFDRISEEDMEKYGYEKKDIAKRARQASKTHEDHIFKRSTYRLKEIEENEQGLSRLKSRVGKNVMQGEPLTLAMAKLYKEKYGDNALSVAKKNGYYIPTKEEFISFQQRPREFREKL